MLIWLTSSTETNINSDLTIIFFPFFQQSDRCQKINQTKWDSKQSQYWTKSSKQKNYSLLNFVSTILTNHSHYLVAEKNLGKEKKKKKKRRWYINSKVELS